MKEEPLGIPVADSPPLSAGWLTAAKRRVSVLPLSATVEVAGTREIMRHLLGHLGRPYLVLRLGTIDPHATTPPYAPRLPADQITEERQPRARCRPYGVRRRRDTHRPERRPSTRPHHRPGLPGLQGPGQPDTSLPPILEPTSRSGAAVPATLTASSTNLRITHLRIKAKTTGSEATASHDKGIRMRGPPGRAH